MTKPRGLVLAAALFAAPWFAAAQNTAQAKPRPLVVMTYNIHHGAGNKPCAQPPPSTPPTPDCGLDLDTIADVIRSENADVVGLQEVDRFWARSANVDQPAYLAKRLGMFHCYGANLDHQPDNHSTMPHQYGTAILSRFPILECTNTLLPRTSPSSEQRGLLAARINVRGVPLLFLNTHLHTTQADRAIQVPAILDLIGSRTEPRVLVGDLNAIPTAPEMQAANTALVDALVATAGTDGGYTFPATPARPPDRRIDYIFLSKDVTVTSAVVAGRPLTALASDHYPVTSTVSLPGSAVGIGRDR